MRPGWIGSVLFHGLVTLFAFVTLAAAPPELPAATAVVPVEIIDKITDTTNVTAEAPEAAPPKPDEEVAPEGAAQSVTPPQPETAEPIPDPTQQKLKEQPKPTVKARDFADLFDAAKKNEGRSNASSATARVGDNPRDAIGAGTDMTATESDAIKAAIERHRVKFVDLPNFERYVVTIRIQINADGSLAANPQIVSTSLPAEDPYMKVAVDRSMRAILTAEPLPVDPRRTRRASFTIRFYDKS